MGACARAPEEERQLWCFAHHHTTKELMLSHDYTVTTLSSVSSRDAVHSPPHVAKRHKKARVTRHPEMRYGAPGTRSLGHTQRASRPLRLLGRVVLCVDECDDLVLVHGVHQEDLVESVGRMRKALA